MNKYKPLVRRIINEELSKEQPSAEQGEKLSKVKVRMFFNKLSKNDGLMQYLNFRSSIEQAEAIIKFASLVGVPQSRIPSILASFRQLVATKPPSKQ